MIAAAILLVQSASALPAPSLSDVVRLSPLEAGALVLQGEQHGPVEAVVKSAEIGLPLPSTTELYLVEKARLVRQGCVRTRWKAWFQASPYGDVRAETLQSKSATIEIALPRSQNCPTGQYAHLNPGIDTDSAFGVLRQLDQIRLGRRSVQIICSDETSSDLCTSAKITRLELQKLTPWALTRAGSAFLIWLGRGDSRVTEVRLDAANPNSIRVSRRIPAPS